jgi:hypothetical protein
MSIILSPGQAGDNPQLLALLDQIAVHRDGPGRHRKRPPQLTQGPSVAAAAVAACVAVACADLPNSTGLVVGALAGLVAGALAERARR